MPPANLWRFTFGFLINVSRPSATYPPLLLIMLRVQGKTYSNYLNQIWTQQDCYCTMPELSELKEKKEENPSILLINTDAI